MPFKVWSVSKLAIGVGGLILSVFLIRIAFAQEETKRTNSFYQICTWSHPGTASAVGSTAAKHGAYIVDSVTGELWIVEGNAKPQKLGSLK